MKLLAFSGKKQSGKDTSVKVILGEVLQRIFDLPYYFIEQDKQSPHYGELFTPAVIDGQVLDAVFNIKAGNNNPDIRKNIKIYSFADELKNTVCMRLLGLTYEQCWGTDEDKNTLTKYKWEDMPSVITPDDLGKFLLEINADYNHIQSNEDFNKLPNKLNCILHESGFMTAREVLQFVGTKIFRKMYCDVWVDATINIINEEQPQIALINDCRFPNEAEAIQKAGGKVVRLLRNSDSPDKDASEVALDSYDKFDWVLDNTNMSIEEQKDAILEKLVSWGWN